MHKYTRNTFISLIPVIGHTPEKQLWFCWYLARVCVTLIIQNIFIWWVWRHMT